MTNICKYDIVIVKFPFASSLKYKARPAVVVSSTAYNEDSRDTLLILAISSNVINKLCFEIEVIEWKASGLLKPSIFKSTVATIERSHMLTKVGTLSEVDKSNLEKLISTIC
ncbi:type II toxin-antitoxin system PemK/MazF family toxin [Sulfurovum sp.]|uniref:type II toxin-antitoxin system PemK/MazF family toxin n=1 Tax=Sulfurovum sp. TaxID=1969726 RepID=UPI003459C0AF